MFFIQKEDLPPKYDDLAFFQSAKPTIEIKDDANQMLPILPGSLGTGRNADEIKNSISSSTFLY